MTLWHIFPFFRLSMYPRMEHILSMSNEDDSAGRYGYEYKRIFETVPFCSNGPAGPIWPLILLSMILSNRRSKSKSEEGEFNNNHRKRLWFRNFLISKVWMYKYPSQFTFPHSYQPNSQTRNDFF